MAVPVNFREFTPTNSRQDLLRRLEAAPEQHIEALLASYELLQRMHDAGLIDLANGLLSAGGTVISKISDVMEAREVLTALRTTFMLTNLLRVIDANELHNLLSETSARPASFVGLGRELMNEDVRTGIATSIGLLKILGTAIRKSDEARKSKSAAAKVSRPSA